MRVVIQRVEKAEVEINGKIKRGIEKGLLILVCFQAEDRETDLDWTAQKIVNMRIFDDEAGVMNISVGDIAGEILLVSQFTLYASTKKGNRPSYIRSAKPDIAIPLYDTFVQKLNKMMVKPIVTGEFGADMKISLINDGPITIIVDTDYKE